MPVERVSKGFKDISSSLKVNPLSEDIIAIKNETAIARSIRNLVLTQQGERFFNPILTEVNVLPDHDTGEFNVTIEYEIVGIDLLPQELSFALQPTR